MEKKQATSIRISLTARALLKQLAALDGASRDATVERMIRQEARRAGLAIPDPPPEEKQA